MATRRMIEVLADTDAVEQRASALLIALGDAHISRGDPTFLGTTHTVVLAGGNTPKGVYRRLVDSYPDFKQARAFDANVETVQLYGPPFLYSHIFWGDERCVSPEHERSNVRMARETLLDPLEYPSEQVHPPTGDADDPQQAARDYEREIHRIFASNWEMRSRMEQLIRRGGEEDATVPPDPDQFEKFDIVMLGLGEDGHTASLFPGSPALDEDRRWVVATEHPETGEARLTMTYPCLSRARRILFVVTGENKAEAVRRTLEPASGETPTPAARVTCPGGDILFMLDEAAASGLSEEFRKHTG